MPDLPRDVAEQVEALVRSGAGRKRVHARRVQASTPSPRARGRWTH